MSTFVDTIEWGVTYEVDILIQDVATNGTLSPTDLSAYTVLEGTVKTSAESAAALFTPTITNPAAGTIRFHVSPAQAKLLPRVGLNAQPPQVVGEVRVSKVDGSDALRPLLLVLNVSVGPLT